MAVLIESIVIYFTKMDKKVVVKIILSNEIQNRCYYVTS